MRQDALGNIWSLFIFYNESCVVSCHPKVEDSNLFFIIARMTIIFIITNIYSDICMYVVMGESENDLSNKYKSLM